MIALPARLFYAASGEACLKNRMHKGPSGIDC